VPMRMLVMGEREGCQRARPAGRMAHLRR
jgi:hypothetical protein